MQGDFSPQPNFLPQFTLRSRKEVHTKDSANSRLVEHWQTDTPDLTYSKRKENNLLYMDTNGLPSRLYREDMRQSQPFVPDHSPISMDEINATLSIIQTLGLQISKTRDPNQLSALNNKLDQQQEIYALLIQKNRLIQADSLSQNPYFTKYDVTNDSRNVIRELRSAVSEDITDRGIAESQKLLKREFENRWLPHTEFNNSIKQIDSLEAFDLMRPSFNNMSKTYR